LMLIPKKGETSILVGKLRAEYKKAKKSCGKGVGIKYTQARLLNVQRS